MSTGSDSLDIRRLQAALRSFTAEREWEKFHTPKNLSTALVCEAAELAELFQWATPTESMRVLEDPEAAQAVRDEVADVLIYLLRFADVLDLDLESAAYEKLERNKLKYPAELFRGSRRKPG